MEEISMRVRRVVVPERKRDAPSIYIASQICADFARGSGIRTLTRVFLYTVAKMLQFSLQVFFSAAQNPW
jgi:hypothetical protein